MEVRNMNKEERFYYYALYCFVTHWAGYMATLVMLLTIGIIISTSSVLRHPLYFIIVIIVAGVGSLFFLWRMSTFGGVVNQKIGADVRKTMWIPHPWNLILGGAITFGMTIINLVTLFLTM